MYQYNTLLISLLLIIFSFFPTSLFSQKNFLKGEIITKDDKVIKGEIKYKNWSVNPKTISFRKNDKEDITEYSPSEIKEFTVADEKYIGALVEIETSRMEEEYLSISREFNFEKKLVFIQAIIQGEKSLYHYKDSRRTFFYIQEGSEYILLNYKKYINEINSKKYVKENKSYLSQLNKYLSDCPKIQQELGSLKYELNEMEKVFREFYQCVEKEIDFQKITEKPIQKMGVLGGISLSILNFRTSTNSFQTLTNATFTPSYNLFVGGSYEIVFPRNFYRFSVNNEIIYSSPYRIEGKLESIVNENNYDNHHFEFKFSYINVNSMFRMKVAELEKIKLHLNFGLSAGLAISRSTKRIRERKLNSTSLEFIEYEAIPNPNRHEFGLLSGIKIQAKKLLFEFRYQYRLGMSPFPSLAARRPIGSILVGYNFLTRKER